MEIMKEYNIEEGYNVDVNKLLSPYVPSTEYKHIHERIIRACHDIMVEYDGGILLVVRDRYPAKDILWPIGGAFERGMRSEDSLRDKVRKECNLELVGEIQYLGCARTFFKTDPFNHGRGTDTINDMYFARGEGELRLDGLHKEPTIVFPEDYYKKFRNKLHPYVRDFMDIAIPLVKNRHQLSLKFD